MTVPAFIIASVYTAIYQCKIHCRVNIYSCTELTKQPILTILHGVGGWRVGGGGGGGGVAILCILVTRGCALLFHLYNVQAMHTDIMYSHNMDTIACHAESANQPTKTSMLIVDHRVTQEASSILNFQHKLAIPASKYWHKHVASWERGPSASHGIMYFSPSDNTQSTW